MHGLVLGGGLAGSLAAAALAQHVDEVTVVERDRLPLEPLPRKGLPQGRHVHTLMSTGARAIDSLLPGTTEALLAAGAQYLDVPRRLLALTSGGWRPREGELQYVIGTSRALLDWTVRQRLLAGGRVRFVEGTDAVGLLGDAGRVIGARIRDRRTRRHDSVLADFVVDATGRGSASATWLAALGLPAVTEEVIGPGIAYATRIFRAPDSAGEDFPGVNIAADLAADRYSGAGVLVPVENGQWIVTLSGVIGGDPPVDTEGFTAFAHKLRHPLLGELMARAEPLCEPFGFRVAVNRRLRYDSMERWPERFVVLGDAACEFNPVYGHGMIIAARGAVALHNGIRRHGLGPATARLVQRAVTGCGEDAWQLTTGQDTRVLCGLTGERPDLSTRLRYRFLDRMMRSSTSRPAITAAQYEVFVLAKPARSLLAPRVIFDTLRGPARPPLTEPPLTPAERSLLYDE